MARQRSPWSTLRGQIYRKLNETEGASFWSVATLLDLFNDAKDLREMQLQNRHEGFGVRTFTADLVADQKFYTIPEDAGRLKRVIRVLENGLREQPLVRSERFESGLSEESLPTDDQYIPTYRLVGNFIKLEPKPGASVTGGLKIEMEEASDRIANDTDTIPAGWPIFTEPLLVFDTVLLALDIEGAPNPGEERLRSFDIPRQALVSEWLSYTETRSFGPVYGKRYNLGA